jgi:hypothetical protein
MKSKMVRIRRFAAALAMISGAFLTGSAGQAVAQQTLSFNVFYRAEPNGFPLPGPSAETLDFAPFDKALGTLTEVDVALNASVFADALVSVQAAFPYVGPVSGFVSQSYTFLIEDPNSSTLISATGSVGASCFGFGGCDGESEGGIDSPFEPNPAQITAPTALALFETGTEAPLTSVIQPGELTAGCGTGLCFFENAFVEAAFQGDLTVSYVYTPAITGIPEPSTWAMILLGFVGLGYAGYRRARAGHATLAV